MPDNALDAPAPVQDKAPQADQEESWIAKIYKNLAKDIAEVASPFTGAAKGSVTGHASNGKFRFITSLSDQLLRVTFNRDGFTITLKTRD